MTHVDFVVSRIPVREMAEMGQQLRNYFSYLSRKCGFDAGATAAIFRDESTFIESSPMSDEYLTKPSLIVVVDTEEEFDWAQPFSRDATGVGHIRDQEKAQRLFDRYNVRPTYVIDYPVASQEAAFRPLGEWFGEGRCGLGAHLHPWVNPPFEEEVSRFNSFPGNLAPSVERAKLTQLSETIERNLGYRPTIYRAGRYGIGPETAAILSDLGYQIDTSLAPYTDHSGDGGPNFSRLSRTPFWFGPGRRLLEIPLTVDWCGLLRQLGASLGPHLMSRAGMKIHLPELLSRFGLLERIHLSPEGMDFAELKRLTETLLARGTRVFVFSYHSPSLAPGNTPYVRNAAELAQFLGKIDQYCEFFLGTCGGTSISPHDLRLAMIQAGYPGGVTSELRRELVITAPS